MSVKQTLGWIAAGLGILLVVLIVGGYLYLETSSFDRFAIRKIVEVAETATGGKVEIGGFDLDLKTLTAHLYNITLHGAEASGEPALLHADKLTVGIKIGALLHPNLTIRELVLDHPVVHVEVSREGKNNLPTVPPSKTSGRTSVFDLAVGHAQITNGEVDYNDRKIPLDADLYDLATDVYFFSPARRYDGNLSYRKGHLGYAENTPMRHSLNLAFSATPNTFDLRSLTLGVGSSQVNLTAQISNYAKPVADGDYRIRIHTQDFAEIAPPVSPAGDLLLSGKLHYRSSETNPILRNVSLSGELASEVVRARMPGRDIELRKLQGSYRLADGNLEIPKLTVETLGGKISALAEMKHLDATNESNIRASLDGISLRAIQRAAGQRNLQTVTLSGTLGGNIEASWKGGPANLRARSDFTVRAAASSRSNPSAHEVPLNGALHVSYDGPRQTIEIANTTFHLPSATLTAQGSISKHSDLQIRGAASDLHQLAALISSFRSTASPPAVSGSATLSASVRGSMKQPAVDVQLNGQHLEIEGSEWSTATIAMHANPSQITIDNASLLNAQSGEASLTAAVALRKWSYDASNRIEAHVRAQKLRLSDLQKLANQSYPISGDLSGDISLSGSQLQPVGAGSATIANGHAYGEPILNFAANFKAANGSIDSTLNVSTAAGAVDANVSYTPRTKAYEVQLKAPGIVLQKLQVLQEKNLAVNGTISASVHGAGTLDDPQLTATVELPRLQMRQTIISGFKADVRVAQHRADLNLDTKVSAASIHARGDINLTGDYQTQATIDTGTIPLDALIAAYAPSVPPGFQGQTELHASLNGPLQNKSKIEAHLTIPVLQARYQQLEIGIPRPLRLDYANSVVTLQPAEIRGTDTSLRAQGRIPIGQFAAPTLTAQGSIDMRIVQIVAPTVKSSGVVTLDVRSSGSASKPEIQGQVQLKDVAMTTPDSPIGIEKLSGSMDIGDGHVQLSKMTAQMGGGQVSIGGSIAYKPAVEFNVTMQGKSVRLLYPEGLRSLLDSNLAFTGTTQASTLSGRVLIDSLSFTPDFDLSSFSDQFSTGTVPAQPGFADTIRLAVNVQSNNLNAVSSQISIAGQAALQVGGTAANPVITGRTTLNSGELFFRNVRYQLQRGVITFDDPNQTHPVLRVTATTTIEQYNLTLTLRGPLDKLTTAYVSDPPLATADIINLVARGKTTEEQAASSQSTDSMIASQVAGQLSSSVQKLAGISSLAIDPTLGGNNSNPSARIAFQQRVTKNFLFSFSTDVSQPGNEIVQGEYQLNKRWSVSVERDQLGGVAVDGKFHKRF